jgi:hypothetical protein
MMLAEASQRREFIASPRTRGFARLAVILFDSAKGKLGRAKCARVSDDSYHF